MVNSLNAGLGVACEFVREYRNMPRVEIAFLENSPAGATFEKSREVFKLFTKRHRVVLFRNKTIGIALINLSAFDNFQGYLKSIDGKNSAAYYARKAKKRSYKFTTIDRNSYVQDISEINTSAEYRQGRRVPDSFFEVDRRYETHQGYKYFGILNDEGKLVAYCTVGFYGEFALVPQLLGHAAFLNDGIMYYMLTEVVRFLYEDNPDKRCRFLMYDTFIGASDGLKKFKMKLGFSPYRVSWRWSR